MDTWGALMIIKGSTKSVILCRKVLIILELKKFNLRYQIQAFKWIEIKQNDSIILFRGRSDSRNLKRMKIFLFIEQNEK